MSAGEHNSQASELLLLPRAFWRLRYLRRFCQKPKIHFKRRGPGIFSVLFTIEIFDKPDSCGNARLIERRTHTGPSVAEALRTARANLRTPPPSAYSFSMWAGGREVGRWQRGDHGNKADILHDLESARKYDE